MESLIAHPESSYKITPVMIAPLPGYKLEVSFNDGITGVIDLSNFVINGIFKPLQQIEFFNQVYPNGSAIAWNEELEIDALAIHAELMRNRVNDIFTPAQ